MATKDPKKHPEQTVSKKNDRNKKKNIIDKIKDKMHSFKKEDPNIYPLW